MKQKLLFIAAMTIFSAVSAFAQSPSKITGEIKDNNGKALNAATIMLFRAKDSVLVKTEVTNTSGIYEFPLLKPGNYFTRTSVVNMQPTSSAVITVKEGETVNAPSIGLKAGNKTLTAVTVTSKKPMIEVKADKTIVNVEGTINAVGNDGLELLRRSPGVMIDKDDNISLAGKNGVKIYIDGKPSPLSGTDLSSYLKSLQSAQIESIEIITNPSAKYEAEGNAGIINIKLKKNLAVGTNGSVNGGYNIGTYGKYNVGINLNHRNMTSNTFGSYNFNENYNEFTMHLYRVGLDTIFDQHNRILNKNKGSHNFKGGMDFFLNKKSTVGFVVNGNISSNQALTNGPMDIIYQPTMVLDRTLYATSDNKTKRTNMNFNGNYRYAVTGGSELNIDADYGFYKIRNDQMQPNISIDKSGVLVSSDIAHMISPTDINIASLKADYEQNFKKGRLGYGGKIGFVSTDNDFVSDSITIFGMEVYDSSRSNRFQYKENINAGYVNYNTALKTGWVIQAGLRVENTNVDGQSTGSKLDTTVKKYVPYDSSLKRNYVDFFPSFAFTYNKNPLNQWGISYSRRIDRPAYQDLNPFEFRLNSYSYQKGNTQLRPQYTNSYSITNTFKYKLNTRLNYSHVKDMFAMLPDTLGSKAFVMKKNLAKQDILSLNISYPFQWKWYSFFVNMNSYYSHYQSKEFGTGDRSVNLEVYSVSFFMQNSFKLGKGYSAELSGFFNSPTIWQGAFKSKSIYNIDGGLQKTIMKGKGTVKAAVSDMFNILKFVGTSDYTGQHMEFHGKPESRQFKISANIRFGSTQVKASRQRKTGIEDENNRTNSSGGIGGQ